MNPHRNVMGDPYRNPAVPHLVVGGARSGKSLFAEGLFPAWSPPYLYVATAEVRDEEMQKRAMVHRARRGKDWETVECPRNITTFLDEDAQAKASPVLVDCLTLWLSNLLLDGGESSARKEVTRLVEILRDRDVPLVLVANEVGTGIVPANSLARTFRDLAGWTNQMVAKVCGGVTYMVAGLPLPLKPAIWELDTQWRTGIGRC